VSHRTDSPPVPATPPRGILAWLRAWGPALVVGAALATVTAVTGFISYTHICALTLQLHQSWKTAHLTPLAVDGQIVIGSVVLATGHPGQRRWGWLGVGPGLAESLFANWESGIIHGHLAAIWATVAAQSFAVATFLFERWLKSQVGRGGQDGRSGQAYESSNAVGLGENDTDPCPHKTPRTVEEAVIFAFLHARECAGQPLSQRELSAAFGISRARVAELVGPYLPPEPVAAMNGSAAGG
jgi:hypothetical protein